MIGYSPNLSTALERSISYDGEDVLTFQISNIMEYFQYSSMSSKVLEEKKEEKIYIYWSKKYLETFFLSL